MARVLYGDNSIETFDVEENKEYIALSTVYKEDYGLLKVLEKLECEVVEVHDPWPRDHYAYHDNNYIREFDLDSLGEGGYYAYGKNYIIISEKAIANKDDAELVSNFFGANVHILKPIKPLRKSSMIEWGHIDLTVLPVPQRDIIFVDKRHYVQQKKKLHEIAEMENQKLIPVYTVSKNFPLNSLVLEKNGEAVVITNSSFCRSFIKALAKEDIEVHSVKMYERPKKGGSIRCASNIAPSKDFLYDVLKVEIK